MTYSEAINYLTTEGDSWNGADKNSIEDALTKLNGSSQDKAEAMDILNDLYWDSNQVTHQCEFGQAVFAVGYTVDPTKTFPKDKI